MGEQKKSAKNLRRSRIPDISSMVRFYFPIEVCCCRFTAKILRLFLCALLKVLGLRMTKYCVTQVAAVWFVLFTDRRGRRSLQTKKERTLYCNSNIMEFLGWRHQIPPTLSLALFVHVILEQDDTPSGFFASLKNDNEGDRRREGSRTKSSIPLRSTQDDPREQCYI